MTTRPTVQAELSRDLKLSHVTLMGMGMMIGAGVFVGIGLCMKGAGPGGLLLTFALNGLIALFSAMSFAELASAVPRAGGAYNFARIGYGRPASFIAGWMEWLAASAAGGFYAIVLAKYTLGFFGALGYLSQDTLVWGERLFAVAAASLFVFINYRGTSETGKIGAWFTIGQMVFVLAVAAVGIVTFFFHPSRIANFQPFIHPEGWWKLLGTMGIIYVAFEGFEVIAQAGDETIDPKKNIPKAILYSVLFVTVTYVAVAFATVVAIGPSDPELGGLAPWRWIGSQEEMGFRAAVSKLLPGRFPGQLLVTLAVVFSATSALNATIYSATRTSYALGRDRMLPAFFSRIGSKRRTPYVALGFTSLIVLTVALTLNPKHGAATASIMFLLLFFLVNVCVIRIRRHMGDEMEYGYIMPLFPLFPILAIVLQLALAGGIFHESLIAWAIAGVWVPAGAVIYLLYSRKRTIVTEEEITVIHEEASHPPRADEYRIMVAVANPENALQLVQNTYKFCAARENPTVELIHMVPVPSQVPLNEAERYMVEGREAIMETMLYLGPLYPIRTTLRYCRNPARGIVSAVTEKRIDTLILGWHGRARSSGFRLGATVDPILERAACNVLMLKNTGGNKTFKKVLVPLAGGPNGALALETASILVDPEEGQIVPFTVAGGRRGGFDIGEFVAQHRDRIALPDDRIHIEIGMGKDVQAAILRKAEECDLVVLGSTREGFIRQMAHVPIPESVARECETPLIMCRAAAGLQSWIHKFF